MKRLERKNRGLDYVRFLAEFSKREGFRGYSAEVLEAFGEEAARELASVVTAGTRIAGIRGEAMFMAVVAGLGRVPFIKSEDEGDVFYQGADIQSPDFRIVLPDGGAMLVEVKVLRMKNIRASLKLGDTYVQQLRRYAELMKIDLRVAIYWDELRTWTLNPFEAFKPGGHGTKWSIDFERAFCTTEMAIVGDRMIATPAPLVFRVNFDPDKSDPMPEVDAEVKATIRSLELLSRDRKLTGRAAEVALALLWHGTWSDAGQHIEQNGESMIWLDHLYGPSAEQDDWGDGFHMIGSLSSIISSAYLEGAVSTVHTTSESRVLAPGSMRQLIPEDLTELELPLALLEIQSNLRPVDPDEAS